ncbi:MAG: hypothetical protein LUD22_04300, partial [Coprobacillus sp.]|nr:hypothetical protein [Coprobacillus sp.]
LVEFYPTESVTTPDWYVPTTGSSAITDLFNAALEGKNYTIVLEITDYQSNETAYDPNGFSPYVQLEPLQDLWCKITYTADAAVVEYYANYEELLAGTVMDVEYYLNTDAGLDIFMIYDWYEVDTVYYQWTEEGSTWQDYLGSLFGLGDYFSNFVEGETTTTERGTEVSYTLDNLDSDFLEALIDALVDNGNYWAWETGGIDEITDISCSYLVDSEILEFVFYTGEYTYYDADNFCYYIEQTTIKVYVLEVGSSSTPSYTLEYNW